MKPDEKTIWRSPLPAVGDSVPKTAATAAVVSTGVCFDPLRSGLSGRTGTASYI